MTNFPLTLTALFLVVVVVVLALRAVAVAGTKKACAHRELLRDATPPHRRGRRPDFDEYGRPLS